LFDTLIIEELTKTAKELILRSFFANWHSNCIVLLKECFFDTSTTTIKEIVMPTINSNMINSIQDFSNQLTNDQLEQFLDIVDSLNNLLVMANQDTDKAYQLYLESLNTLANRQQDETQMAENLPVEVTASNVYQIKH